MLGRSATARAAGATGSLAGPVPVDRSASDLVHTCEGVQFGALGLPSSVAAYISAHARDRGDAPFLTVVSEEHEARELTYGELDAVTAQVARWLRRELDAGGETVLALPPTNDLPSVLAILGVLRSGSPLLLVNPADPPGRVREQVETLGARLLRQHTLDAQRHPDALALPDPAMLDHADEPWSDPEIDSAADALYFGTSGSTATSKLVAQAHRNAVANAHAVGRHHSLRPGDRILGCLPIHHVNGLHFTLLATLVAGAHAMLAHGFEPVGYPELVMRFRPRIASVVPTILEVLADTWRGTAPPRELEYFVSAAAPLTTRTARRVVDRLGVRVNQGYGLTETTNFSTTMPADLPAASYRKLALEGDIPSIGSALEGNEVAVLGAGGEPVAPGEMGEICMRGHNVMSRYAANPDATEEAFRGGWFHSGDMGFAVEEAGRTFFVLTGRRKNIAKVRGESVSLDEMDRALRSAPQVVDAACVTVPHRLLGEEIVAAVVVGDGREDLDLRSHLGSTFAPAVLPRHIVELDELPRTPTGKIRRRELAATIASRLAGG
jgi:acyl-CoA synthetase (AMP-forming)/AMP-acid ligase II